MRLVQKRTRQFLFPLPRLPPLKAGPSGIRSYLFAVHATGCDPPSVRGVAEATPGQRGSVHQPLYAALQRHKEERNAFLDQARPLSGPLSGIQARGRD